MNYVQVIDEIRHWDSTDKWALLELLLRDLRPVDDRALSTQETLSTPERLRIAHDLYGYIRPAHGSMPDDEDVRQIILEERFHKYT